MAHRTHQQKKTRSYEYCTHFTTCPCPTLPGAPGFGPRAAECPASNLCPSAGGAEGSRGKGHASDPRQLPRSTLFHRSCSLKREHVTRSSLTTKHSGLTAGSEWLPGLVLAPALGFERHFLDGTGPTWETRGAAVLCPALTIVDRTLILPSFQTRKSSKETFGCPGVLYQ